ncbi:13842_t:CDS:2, partial [Cetraspora pellucida]
WKELGLGDDCLKTNNLDDYMTLCYDFEQYNPEAVRLLTKEKLEEEYKKTKLEKIKKKQERLKKNLEFKEQEEMKMIVKRKAIVQFKEILEKEFNKCGQFKFALCSLTKFLIDNKPGNNNAEKKNSQTN